MTNVNPDMTGLSRKGRPPGAKNRKTIALQAAARATIGNLAPDDIARMTPLEVLLRVMAAQLNAGELMAAASVAEKAAPYVHGRVGAVIPDTGLPAELMPDPPAHPDEPGPPGGIIE